MSLSEHARDHIDPPRVTGVLCTYGRPRSALDYLEILDRQTLRLDIVYVIDNASDPALRKLIEARPASGVHAEYVGPGSNLGPAGAFSLGFELILSTALADDIVVHLDDDDPPVLDDQLERLLSTLTNERKLDPTVGGVGLSGGSLRRRTGLIESSADTGRLARVDHLHGGYLPMYTVGALELVGSHDASFFYGFEELELGRRLHGQGCRLLVDVAAARDALLEYPKKAQRVVIDRPGPTEGEWSRFHKERNLIRIFARERLWSAVVFTTLARHVAKPVWLGARDPRLGWSRFRLGLRAVRSGLRGESGIDARYLPESDLIR